MCVVSAVIGGMEGPDWPGYKQFPNPWQPAPNYTPWNLIQSDPALANQILDVLKKLEEIDKRLGKIEQCLVEQERKDLILKKLQEIAKELDDGRTSEPVA